LRRAAIEDRYPPYAAWRERQPYIEYELKPAYQTATNADYK